MPCAYLIAAVDVTDPVRYEQYKKLSSAAIETHGAQICARGGHIEVLEGDWAPERLVVLKFGSVEAARAFSASPEYGQARAVRAGAASMRMIVVEGVD